MAKRRKIKLKWPSYVLIALIVLIPSFIIFKNISKKHNSVEYRLNAIGYNENEIKKLKTLNSDSIEFILDSDYQKLYIDIVNEKYFLKEHFLEYIDQNKKNDFELPFLISYVNTLSYKEDYEEALKTDVTDGLLMLVNKNNYLESTYSPSDLKDVSNWYAYEGRKLSDIAYQAYINMFNTAKEEDIHLIIVNGYRSYEEQDNLFETYKNDYGERRADELTTRAGFSEYQLGLALNIYQYYGKEKFVDTDEYKWLIDNSYKFGFILRCPEGKKLITGYDFEPYHFRYVGVEAATVITNENITLEEYHAYYLK